MGILLDKWGFLYYLCSVTKNNKIMKGTFYQLEVTIKGTKKNEHAVVINRFRELEAAKRFFETFKKESEDDIASVVIKSINTEIL